MAATSQCLASLARLSLSAPARPILQTTIPRFLAPAAIAQQARHATGRQSGNKKTERKRKQAKVFEREKSDAIQKFSLCDAMRYARAFEVGRSPYSIKYDLAISLRTPKAGPTIKNRIRLPYPVRSDRRIGVICPENTATAIQARDAGAVAAGEESVFEIIRNGSISFTSMICDLKSADKLAKANLGRLLGPKGLMPNVRQKTITNNVLGLLREMAGQDNYREKQGVIRIAIGQLGFTPEMLAENVKAFMAQVKQDCEDMEQVSKEVHEVVLSTTRGPGFSLDGEFNPTNPNITPAMLSTPM